ncbi:MAG: BON domain-containing protein [Gaiellaceae bacterium]
MDNDQELKQEVERELEWDPKVDAANVGVVVRDGAITLTGYVSTYAEKFAAVRAAERVYGVTAVADEIEVRPSGKNVLDDTAIAEAIKHAFDWSAIIPDTVQAEVRDGGVTLRGDVEWEWQRHAAERTVRDIRGVRWISNLITVKPKVKASAIEERVAEAIKRSAELDARSIWVTTNNGTIHLHGHVHSLHEKRVAESAAASAPGVSRVENDIAVTP